MPSQSNLDISSPEVLSEKQEKEASYILKSSLPGFDYPNISFGEYLSKAIAGHESDLIALVRIYFTADFGTHLGQSPCFAKLLITRSI